MSSSSPYRPTVGLEVHAELKTQTKMFCRCLNNPDEKEANSNICPVCMAHPGSLPVINREAVTHILKMGMAVGGELADFTEFDRKNYFYPDIPKGYQISQYQYPLVKGGSLKGVALTRVHLEEDTARSYHKGDYSLIDFNRAGVPLMELVTEPVIHTAKDAGDFARELQRLLRTLGVGEANMEKGQMRIEANISVGKDGVRGTKVEVKNLNSFRSVERAIAYEVERQIGLLESGGKVIQETRGWDEGGQKTFSQRIKEESHDYRYFPDPDLPKLYLREITELSPENLKATLPELPWNRRDRYMRDFGIKVEDAELYLDDQVAGSFFEDIAQKFMGDVNRIKLANNYLTSDVRGYLSQEGKSFADLKMSIDAFEKLITLTSEGAVSSRGAKEILLVLMEIGGEPEEIARVQGLFQQSDEGALEKIVEAIIEKNSAVVAEYKSGKEASLQYLIGQGMKESKGSANPEILRSLLTKKIRQE